MSERKCPACGEDACKVLFVGFPMLLCADSKCSCLWGIWSWVALIFPVSNEDGYFAFMGYTGGYLPALWRWLLGGPQSEA